jgi:hypothetical protein
MVLGNGCDGTQSAQHAQLQSQDVLLPFACNEIRRSVQTSRSRLQ